MKKIVAITMVKNEMDIIESFVRHTLGFSDLLIVADHKSSDRTREILEALQAEGLPIIIEDVVAARHVQAETMTHLLWEASDDYAADLVLPLDGDEFLVPRGTGVVRDLLETLAIEDVRALPWWQYAPSDDEGIPEGTFALSVPLLRAPSQFSQKIVVHGGFVRREHVRLSEGNHLIIQETASVRRGDCGDTCEQMELAHLPWRSPAQIRSKYAVGWPNIAGKYGLNTVSGIGYREMFAQIRKGEIPPKGENIDAWTPCKLDGRVPFPMLQYSENTMPDVLANVMASSEALAAELAETRALASRPMVTTVVPYFGEGGQPSYLDKHFCKSLAAALAEDYPWHEVIVPVFGGSIPQEFVRNALNRGVRLCLPEHLCSAARGNYVEWLLPGDIPRREKLRNMITCAELQDRIYPILLSEARSGVLEMSPMVNFGVSAKENCRMISCEAAWSWLLLQGKVPSRGMAGVLVKKSVFDDCRGLVDCFEAGRPHVFLMWRELLLAGGEQMGMQMCVMHEDETESGAELHLEELAAHQLDWHALCILDRALLSKETQEEILNRQRRIGIYLLEHAIDEGVDLQLGIWPEYQQMLMTL